MNARPLTFEETQGTKTYYLPFERSSLVGPEATVMVKRLGDGTFIAGVTVRSLEEPFTKVEGRYRAFLRLQHAPYGQGAFRAADPQDLADQIALMFQRIQSHRGLTVSMSSLQDLAPLAEGLIDAFDKLDANRLARDMQGVPAVAVAGAS